MQDVLEVAHLRPYRGPASNVISNDLLLRADIRTLLDLQLTAFDSDTRRLVIARSRASTQYEELTAGSSPSHRSLWRGQPPKHCVNYGKTSRT